MVRVTNAEKVKGLLMLEGIPPELAVLASDFVARLDAHFDGKPECGRMPSHPDHIRKSREFLDLLK